MLYCDRFIVFFVSSFKLEAQRMIFYIDEGLQWKTCESGGGPPNLWQLLPSNTREHMGTVNIRQIFHRGHRQEFLRKAASQVAQMDSWHWNSRRLSGCPKAPRRGRGRAEDSTALNMRAIGLLLIQSSWSLEISCLETGLQRFYLKPFLDSIQRTGLMVWLYPWRILTVLLYMVCHGSHQYTPSMLAYMGLSENRLYSQWNSHLIGIMISKTIGFFGVLTNIFRQTHIPAPAGSVMGYTRWFDWSLCASVDLQTLLLRTSLLLLSTWLPQCRPGPDFE